MSNSTALQVLTIFFGVVFLAIFFIYFIYRFFVLFGIKRPQLQRFLPVFSHPKYLVLSDGYRAESEIFVGTSDVVFITLHGMGGDKTEFTAFGKLALSKGHSTINWSQRNWGLNPSNSSYHVETLCEDAYDVLQIAKKHFPKKRFVFVGHSLGAMTLGKFLGKYPEIENSIRFCLVNFVTAHFLNLKRFSLINWYLVKQAIKGFLVNRESALRLQADESIEKKLPADYRRVILNDKKKLIPFYFATNSYSLIYHVPGALKQNKTNSVLLIFGGKDPLQSQKRIRSLSREFAQTNKNIRFILNTDMGHLFPFNQKKVHIFYNQILDFATQPNTDKKLASNVKIPQIEKVSSSNFSAFELGRSGE